MSARGLDFRFLAQVSVVFGAGMMVAGIWLRLRLAPPDVPHPRRATVAGDGPQDFGQAPFVIGAVMLWCCLWAYPPVSTAWRFAHAAANAGFLIGYAVPWPPMRRNIMLALGSLGLCMHLIAWVAADAPLVQEAFRALRLLDGV